MYDFKPEYLTGIEEIDKEHKMLFAYADNTYHLLQEEFLSDKYDQIVAILNELCDYAVVHFANEEKYMSSINYEGLSVQRKQHKIFTDKLSEIDLDSISDTENQDAVIMKLLTFLTDWLINHIVGLDTKIPCKA